MALICMGEFNDMLAGSEKQVGICRTVIQLNLGRQVMAECGLQDIDFDAYPFTWTNGRQGQNNIQCRIDRAFATESCSSRFSPIKVSHLSRFGSDQVVVRVVLECQGHIEGNKRRHLFKFEEVWAREEMCECVLHKN